MKNTDFKVSVDECEVVYTAKNNENYNLHFQTQIVTG